MFWFSKLSTLSESLAATTEVVDAALEALGGRRPDVAIVFVSPDHRSHAAEIVRELARLDAFVLVGCSGAGIIGEACEIEHATAVSLTVAVLPGVRVESFAIESADFPAVDAPAAEWSEAFGLDEPSRDGMILLADPFSFDIASFLAAESGPQRHVPLVGGLASGGRQPGDTFLLCDDRVLTSGAVGISFYGNLLIDTVVAQGCRPIGEPLFVTSADGNIIRSLDGEIPQTLVRDLFQKLPRRDQELFRHSLFLGIVMEPNRPRYGQGDFLIRNVMGFDRDSGALVVAAPVRSQLVVQFHLRDAQAAHDDLAAQLKALRARIDEETAGAVDRQPSGVLLFSCLGRGEGLYGEPNHDTNLVQEGFGKVAVGGFFCNGEIGPVQGTPYLHGYTSALALFRPKR